MMMVLTSFTTVDLNRGTNKATPSFDTKGGQQLPKSKGLDVSNADISAIIFTTTYDTKGGQQLPKTKGLD